MEARKNSVAVAQHKYNQFRSRVPTAEVAIVEGTEDSIFYSSVFSREKCNSIEHFFVANGKDNVLGLRKIILESKDTTRGNGVVFFVDHDYDGLKNHVDGNDIYTTPTYSIENILVCKDAFRKLLLTDLKLSDGDLVGDLDRILVLFDNFIELHSKELKEVNEKIYFIRQEKLKGNILTNGSIDNNEKLFADLDFNTLLIEKKATGNQIEKLISANILINHTNLAPYKNDFENLIPKDQWRGKFIYYLFKKFIAILVEDRNSDNSKYFSKGKGKISLNTKDDSFIRTLALLCTLPQCLIEFINDIQNKKLN